MAKQVNRLTDPMDFLRILQVASDLLASSLDGTVQTSYTDADQVADLLWSTITLMRGWPNASQMACESRNGAFCVTVQQTQTEIMKLLLRLGDQLSSWRLTDGWSVLFQETGLESDIVIYSMNGVMAGVAAALNMTELCHQKWHSQIRLTDSATVIQQSVISSPCLANKYITIAVPGSKQNVQPDLFRVDTSLISINSTQPGYFTLMRLSSPVPETVWISGGLPVSAFTNETLYGPLISNRSTDPALVLVLSKTSALRIASPIYVFDTNFPFNSVSASSNEVIRFTIQLSD
ncbi:unnamed protein product, partial [Echinostoma caproni]|uniref:Dynein_C domain-containing protein n=1 Tax=Echinostoma caproni TaxID=27848 RepID=A0A183A2I5_9TREM